MVRSRVEGVDSPPPEPSQQGFGSFFSASINKNAFFAVAQNNNLHR